mmetsp:Transcript_61647/g.143432  ORF Transcript_61647/g.143432 Transcript_61647/m.143432 type:complete len:239 (+) Transcript_61647:654-1370(+)
MTRVIEDERVLRNAPPPDVNDHAHDVLLRALLVPQRRVVCARFIRQVLHHLEGKLRVEWTIAVWRGSSPRLLVAGIVNAGDEHVDLTLERERRVRVDAHGVHIIVQVAWIRILRQRRLDCRHWHGRRDVHGRSLTHWHVRHRHDNPLVPWHRSWNGERSRHTVGCRQRLRLPNHPLWLQRHWNSAGSSIRRRPSTRCRHWCSGYRQRASWERIGSRLYHAGQGTRSRSTGCWRHRRRD